MSPDGRESGSHGGAARRWPMPLAVGVVAAIALLLRLPALTAAYPYINYVDEGNLLLPVAEMLQRGLWVPHAYLYPSLPLIVTATAARLLDAVQRVLGHRGNLLAGLDQGSGFYDLISPQLLVVGRLTSLLASLAVVAIAGLLARRLGGPRAGIAAALLCAVAPPLVIRSAVATVDPWPALFVLATMLFAERLRTAEHSGREAIAAGAMIGLAFVSKYPAVLVGLAPVWIVLRSGIPWTAKLRQIGLGAAGAAVAAVLAMPGLVLHPRLVAEGIQQQRMLYSTLRSGASLLSQLLVRAEWDQPYDHPELGAVFLLLVVVALVAALRDRKLSTTVHGWLLFAGASVLFQSTYSFRAFRNLLPLVAPACILVALLWVDIRRRLRRPAWADVAASALLAVFFAAPVAGYAWERLHAHDSRRDAVDWLASRVQRGDAVLIVRDTTFLRSELERLDVNVVQRHWALVPQALAKLPFRFLVANQPAVDQGIHLDPTRRRSLLAPFALRIRFGRQPTPPDRYWWRTNDLLLEIYERRPAPTGRTSSARSEGAGEIQERSSATPRRP